MKNMFPDIAIFEFMGAAGLIRAHSRFPREVKLEIRNSRRINNP